MDFYTEFGLAQEAATARHQRRYRVSRWLTTILVVVASFAICSCNNNDDGGNVFTLRADLSGAQEVPANASASSGTVDLTVSEDFSEITFTLTLTTALSGITMAHIHVGPSGSNGPIILFFCTNQTPPANVPTPPACPTAPGTLTGTLTGAHLVIGTGPSAAGVNTFADAVTQLLDGDTYSNVHTNAFPGGEIRGQNVLQ